MEQKIKAEGKYSKLGSSVRWQILVLEELLREARISALGLAGTHPSLRSVILTLSEIAVLSCHLLS